MGTCFSTKANEDTVQQTPAAPSAKPTAAPQAEKHEKKHDAAPSHKKQKVEEPGEVVIHCEKVWIGHVIGHHGATIKEIQQSTGAHVQVGDSHKEDPVSITITGSPKDVKAAKAKVEAIIKDAEHPDYEGTEGKKWRAEADRCAKMAEECAKEKDALFAKGDKKAGHKKLDEVKEWQKKMHQANEKAAHAIFEHRNKGKGPRYMDFHGLRKSEAMDILETKMTALEGKGGTVELIPGAGHHSSGHHAVLKPAIIEYLKKKNLTYEEKNAGDLIVHL